ncbi:hypothetical protein I79_017420 [Cricetulus griseus]|uniref:Uncharacterized protein n=1 Tax=Cricetulus griseus TaxID=10029 RepID=G3I1Z9_CRIGR|nr:hypothetical protein I79_017420 [Cricetulus griseus]
MPFLWQLWLAFPGQLHLEGVLSLAQKHLQSHQAMRSEWGVPLSMSQLLCKGYIEGPRPATLACLVPQYKVV